MSFANEPKDISFKHQVHSLKDSLRKELTKSEGKQYTKNFMKKTAKTVKQILNNSLQPENFKINVIPSEDSKLYVEIEPTEKEKQEYKPNNI